MSLTYNQLFEAKLRAAVDQRVGNLKDILAAGALTPEGYQNHCGQIAAFNAVDEICDEVKAELDKR